MGKIRIGVSSCLLGEEVRWDGGHKRDPMVVEELSDRFEWVSSCPEEGAGLGTPREPMDLQGDPDAPAMVGHESGADHGPALRAYAMRRIEELRRRGIRGYILKSRSPSCGLDVPMGGVDGANVLRGPGLFAGLLLLRMPDLPVIEEEDLASPEHRAEWMARVAEYDRTQPG